MLVSEMIFQMDTDKLGAGGAPKKWEKKNV